MSKTGAAATERKIVVMRPAAEEGGWRPRTKDDRRLLERLLRPRAGDTTGPYDQVVGYLIARCASRGVAVTFDPAPDDSPPLPANRPATRR